jgi:hypothetical protein
MRFVAVFLSMVVAGRDGIVAEDRRVISFRALRTASFGYFSAD